MKLILSLLIIVPYLVSSKPKPGPDPATPTDLLFDSLLTSFLATNGKSIDPLSLEDQSLVIPLEERLNVSLTINAKNNRVIGLKSLARSGHIQQAVDQNNTFVLKIPMISNATTFQSRLVTTIGVQDEGIPSPPIGINVTIEKVEYLVKVMMYPLDTKIDVEVQEMTSILVSFYKPTEPRLFRSASSKVTNCSLGRPISNFTQKVLATALENFFKDFPFDPLSFERKLEVK